MTQPGLQTADGETDSSRVAIRAGGRKSRLSVGIGKGGMARSFASAAAYLRMSQIFGVKAGSFRA